MRLPLRPLANSLLLTLTVAGCGGEPPPLYGEGITPGGNDPGGPGPVDCSTPCKCPDRGPPDFSKENAGKPSASSDESQIAALVRANRWRTAAGLTPLNNQAQIEDAAMAHANFMQMNDRARCYPGAHDEKMGCAGFTGQWPWDRMKAAGYAYSTASEVIAGVGDPTRAVDEWIWTPYHRMPFMDYQFVDVGYGYAGQHNVMNFGAPEGKKGTPPPKPTVFPAPGQAEVQNEFSGRESPQPPEPPTGWPSGTVISIHFPSSNWKITEHHVYSTKGGACEDVPHVYIDKDNNDTLKDSDMVFMYPHQPLDGNAEYVASFSGTLGGTPFTRTWAFRTR